VRDIASRVGVAMEIATESRESELAYLVGSLPRLVVALTLAEAFGYSQIVLTGRELGTGLIIEAALNRR
jgi:hypothetical protein